MPECVIVEIRMQTHSIDLLKLLYRVAYLYLGTVANTKSPAALVTTHI